jgi:hypothetical protein
MKAYPTEQNLKRVLGVKTPKTVRKKIKLLMPLLSEKMDSEVSSIASFFEKFQVKLTDQRNYRMLLG